MFYAKIGDIEFKGLLGFGSFNRSTAGRFPELARIGRKPKTQATGAELETFTISIPIHREFEDPEAIAAILRGYNQNGSIVPFIDGAGTYFGKFVVLSVSEEVGILDIDGSKISVNLSIELREYVDADSETTEAISARNSAAALSENSPQETSNVTTSSTLFLETLSATATGQANVNDSLPLVNAAAVNPSQKDSLLTKVKIKMEAAIDSFNTAVDKVREVSGAFEQASSDFEFDLEGIITTANSLKVAAQNGDLTGALNHSQNMIAKAGRLDNSKRPLDRLAITRKTL